MKISEPGEFESDLLKTNEDLPPQSRGIKLQTIVGVGGKFRAPPANHDRNVCKIPRLCVAIIFALFRRITFKLCSVDGHSAKGNFFTRNSALRFNCFPFFKAHDVL